MIQTVEAVITPSKSTNTRWPARVGRQLETPAIEGDELVGFVVEAVPRQGNVGMRNHHAREFRIVKVEVVRTCNERWAYIASRDSWSGPAAPE